MGVDGQWPLTNGFSYDCTDWMSMYPYTSDLMCLDFCRPTYSHNCTALQPIYTQLNPDAWQRALRSHPDRAFARLLINGIRGGFRIGFNWARPRKSARRNMPSALEHPEVIDAYLRDERSRGRMLGPYEPEELTGLPAYHINRFGVIPKGHNTGKWRLITDLSYPPGESINDGVDPDLCSLSYTSVEHVAEVASQLGKGTRLAKIDIESAYRLVPVHPQDRPLQAMLWRGQIYIDPMLPFGLRSAPKIFNAIADTFQWYLQQQGIRYVFHYLDDFIVLGAPGTQECDKAMTVLNDACSFLGVPVAEHKREGPSTCLTFLGIEVDTEQSQLRLPQDKLQRLISLLEAWGDRKTCSRKELESLVGLLNHACKVVRSGRAFLRRMIDLLHAVPMHRLRPHPIRLNREFRSDLAWWRCFISKWNGVSFLAPPRHLPAKEMASDASGTWGCGAWHGTRWFQVRWGAVSVELPIMTKELLPIILACELWGPQWEGHCIQCHCDNQAVVACLRSRTSKNPHCLHMLRVLAFVEALYQFHLQPTYITTKANYLADDLSRNNAASFLLKVPRVKREPDTPSTELLELLLDPTVDWVSPRWFRQFRGIFSKVSPPPLDEHTSQQ